MLAAFQVLTIGGMILLTFLIYQSMGPKRASLALTRAERAEWDRLVKRDLGTWLTSSNIFATITSLATVYIFFIGNTYHFGGWVFAAVATLLVGAFVTNGVTRALLARPHIAQRLNTDDQSASVFLTLFWEDNPNGRKTARIIKAITVANIAAILWMDFAVFADISSRLITPDSFRLSLLLLALCAGSVVYFTLRYGLRGFVFADLFQSPLIVLGTVALLVGSVFIIGKGLSVDTGQVDYGAVGIKIWTVLGTPAISTSGGILFVISCLFLNSFLMLVTPPHWLRLWVFREKEITYQVRSIAATCAVWTALILVGALASVALSLDLPANAPDPESNDVVVFFLKSLNENGSHLFSVAFWIAGMAALFASADIQIYSLWLLKNYDTARGKLDADLKLDQRPFLYSIGAAILFTGLYGAVRYFHIPFDKLILVLLPSCLTITPSLVLALRGVRQTPVLPAVAVAAYALLSFLALTVTTHGNELAVAAPIAPLLISVVALIWPKGDDHGARA